MQQFDRFERLVAPPVRHPWIIYSFVFSEGEAYQGIEEAPV